jgi:hypothetical protein
VSASANERFEKPGGSVYLGTNPTNPMEVEPPKGTVFNYPLRPASGQKPSLAASEAAPDVAVQIYNRGVHNQIFARLRDGQTIEQVIAWAQDEIDGYMR